MSKLSADCQRALSDFSALKVHTTTSVAGVQTVERFDVRSASTQAARPRRRRRILAPLALFVFLLAGLIAGRAMWQALYAYDQLTTDARAVNRGSPSADSRSIPDWLPLREIARRYHVHDAMLSDALREAGFAMDVPSTGAAGARSAERAGSIGTGPAPERATQAMQVRERAHWAMLTLQGRIATLNTPRQIASASGRETEEVRRALAEAIGRYRVEHPEVTTRRSEIVRLPPLPQRVPAPPTLPAPSYAGNVLPPLAPVPGVPPLAPIPAVGQPSASQEIALFLSRAGASTSGWLTQTRESLAGLSDGLLELLAQYGYVVLAVATLAGAAGAPVPLTLLLVGAGALAADGTLAFFPAVGVTLTSAVGGDSFGYLVGRRAGRPLLDRAGARFGLTAARLAGTERTFHRWGGVTVWLTRWLVTPLGPAVNLLAGANRYRFASFVAYDAAGEAVWAGGYLGLGWVFGEHWSAAMELAQGIGGAILPGVIAAAAGVSLWQVLRRRTVRLGTQLSGPIALAATPSPERTPDAAPVVLVRIP